MGGNAFRQILTDGAFPRMSPVVYQDLKAHITPTLKRLYKLVETPAEAPEKLDHGDLDFVVCRPLRDVTHEDVRQAIGATHVVPMDGNRTSNYAIPSQQAGDFYQVDVHVSEDEDEWERVVFFHSYGDLGMILGLLARGCGLALGTKGLKIQSSQTDETHLSSFHLCSSFPTILPFFSLSMDTWKRGFSTQAEVFEWISTSRFFYPHRLSDPKKRQRARQDRAMYQSFLEFAYSQRCSSSLDSGPSRPNLSAEEVIEEAKVYFAKKDEYDALVRENVLKRALKERFTGNLVMQWTGLYGIRVREVMHAVRAKFGEDGITNMDLDQINASTIDVQREIGLLKDPDKGST